MASLLHPIRGLAAVGGRALQGTTGAVAALRPADKPLHPQGAVTRATLRRIGGTCRSGAAWLDEAGEDRVLVRLSRAVGLPDPLPDISGLALRAPTPNGGHGDLLLASTGLGRLTRFTLTASRSPWGRPLTTLLPYRTSSGPVLIAAVQLATTPAGTAIELSWAPSAGSWVPFAVLLLHPDAVGDDDADISFDPVLHTLPGLENYDWVRQLRQPSYRTARRSRSSAP